MRIDQLPLRSPVAGLRRRGLSMVEVLAQSVSALAPSAAVVAVPPFVMAQAGAATLPVLVGGTALVVLVGWCLTAFARRMAAVGGVYSYTAKGLGPGAALLAGWALVVGYAGIAVSALVGSVAYLVSFTGLDPPGPAVALVAVSVGLLATLTTVRGIRLSARVALALEVVSVGVVVAVLLVLLAAHDGGSGTGAAVVDGPVSAGGVATGLVLAVAAFMGFESAATLGVEARRPLVAVPRAVFWTPVVTGLLFVAAGVAQVVLLRAAPVEVLTGDVPIAQLADADGLGVLPRLLDAGIALSFFACVTGSINALARVLFSMSREGVLPAPLGRTHPRFATPAVALAWASPLLVVVPAVALASGVRARDVLAGSLTVSALGYVLAYVLAAAAMPVFLHRIGELTRPTLVAGTLAAALSAVVLVVAVAGASWSGSGAMVVVFVVAWLPGPVLWLVLRRRSPETLARVGVYDQATAGSLLPGQGVRR
ncbi:amino acid/polyamine/organocation transporter, APC superfamily (TC 2.A.3) [Klenkia marina]|uniref:Amino acid/polyamine/organocation transporter, APC superfamily (TC 2.A.3) n=1 Tax=Klenkia marina TaxID=1960309 RepID=A0A1G4YL99_9ACTN|nr:APC family permease [Klenkia marina]SCX54261.1 amino acid/polyamine/organocation transporter, APC superfamily (TC 2.A.3) [Klenkia marina]